MRGNEGLTLLATHLSSQVDGTFLSTNEACTLWRGQGEAAGAVRVAAGPACEQLLASSALSSQVASAAALDAFVTKHVGLFPDVLERLAMRHLAKGDEVSRF